MFIKPYLFVNKLTFDCVLLLQSTLHCIIIKSHHKCVASLTTLTSSTTFNFPSTLNPPRLELYFNRHQLYIDYTLTTNYHINNITAHPHTHTQYIRPLNLFYKLNGAKYTLSSNMTSYGIALKMYSYFSSDFPSGIISN